ncbi:MAG TPA: HAMP domain-containing sensor histidine kinase [Streptosporangiaceae bacterium]|nr:HAMP domain-containing sensor histidine kinase [Streptosporangiaceae bacterium]
MRMLPRRTVRLRLTATYGVLFLVSGAVLLVISGGVLSARSSVSAAQTAAPLAPASALSQARAQIRALQQQLADQHTLASGGLSHNLLIAGLIALGIMTVVAGLLGWVTAGRALSPLRAITAATQRISADSLDQRLAMTGPRDELTELADTIDGLLGRLEGAFAAQRRFVANASHELRTPLTTMRASVDVAVAKPGPVPPQTTILAVRVRTELDRVDRLLDGFLALARAQHGDLPGRTTVSLESVVSASLAARADAIAARKLTVQYTTSHDGAWVNGSPTLLRRMVDNVVGNAISHNAQGGWANATVSSGQQTVRLVVETGGEVLDQAKVDQLTQPFRRLGADRTGSDSGSGLGLSIVAAIAEAHGGTLDLTARPEGGLCVTITLPLAHATTATARTEVPA